LSRKILITGINGFLGSRLAIKLKSNFEIIGLEYSIKNLFRIESEQFLVYSSKDNSIESIFSMHNFYGVIHAATIYRNDNRSIDELIFSNVLLPIKILEIANYSNTKFFINIDSFFNNPSYSYSYLSSYTLSKRQTLDWIKILTSNYTIKIINMKIYHMFGENDSPTKFVPFLISKLKGNQSSLDMTPGNQTRDFIYIEDVVDAFQHVINLLENLDQFQEFELGTGISYSIKEFALLVKDITNSKTNLNFGSIPYRKGEIMVSKIENFTLKNLGWKPSFTLREALTKYISSV